MKVNKKRQSRFHNSVITEHFGKGELENGDDKNEKRALSKIVLVREKPKQERRR